MPAEENPAKVAVAPPARVPLPSISLAKVPPGHNVRSADVAEIEPALPRTGT